MRLLRSTSLLLPLLPVIASAQSSFSTLSPASVTPVPSSEERIGYWSPISTITLPIPTESTDPDVHLDLRQVVTAPPAVQTANPIQVSPVTTVLVNAVVNGVNQQIQEVYTQLFSLVPDQGFAPAAGEIGLGTIKGEIGVVKTRAKRSALPQPTQMAASEAFASFETTLEELERNAADGPVEQLIAVEKRSSQNLGGKVEAGAGSALALLVAIAAMIVV